MSLRFKEALAAAFIVLCGGAFFWGAGGIVLPAPSNSAFWPPRGFPHLLDVCLILGLAAVCIAWSLTVAPPSGTLLENCLLPTAALCGAYALGLWLCGLMFPLRIGVFSVIFLLLALTPALPRRTGRARTELGGWMAGWKRQARTDRWLVLYLAVAFCITLVLALAPPTGADYDSLTYHLAAPAQYLRAGRIVELPYDHHSYFPFLTETLYMVGLWARGAVLAKLFHWLMLPAGCAALVAIAQRHLSLRAGLIAAALYAALPVVAYEATTAYIDLSFTTFALLAFLCAANWLALRRVRWLLWLGIFCGFCLGTKYLGALICFFLFAWIASDALRLNSQRLKPIFCGVLLALVVGGPWYARNVAWTRNPVFPFAYGLFDGRGWTLQRSRDYTADQKRFGFGRGFTDWLWLPWRLSMTPLNAGQPYWPLSTVGVNNGSNGLFETPGSALESCIGPMLLAFGLPVVCMRRKPAVVGLALWMTAFLALFWGVTGQYLRYLMPAFALLCLACGWGISQWRGALLKWTAKLSLGLWLLFVPALTLWNAQASLPVIFGQVTDDEYLSRWFGAYGAMHWASLNTPPNARFAVYGEPRCFYLQRDYFWADPEHNMLIDYSASDPESVLRQLRARGVGYLIVNTEPGQNGGGFAAPAQIMQAIQLGRLEIVYQWPPPRYPGGQSDYLVCRLPPAGEEGR